MDIKEMDIIRKIQTVKAHEGKVEKNIFLK